MASYKIFNDKMLLMYYIKKNIYMCNIAKIKRFLLTRIFFFLDICDFPRYKVLDMYYRQMFTYAKLKLYKTNKNVYLTEKEDNIDV